MFNTPQRSTAERLPKARYKAFLYLRRNIRYITVGTMKNRVSYLVSVAKKDKPNIDPYSTFSFINRTFIKAKRRNICKECSIPMNVICRKPATSDMIKDFKVPNLLSSNTDKAKNIRKLKSRGEYSKGKE